MHRITPVLESLFNTGVEYCKVIKNSFTYRTPPMASRILSSRKFLRSWHTGKVGLGTLRWDTEPKTLGLDPTVGP